MKHAKVSREISNEGESWPSGRSHPLLPSAVRMVSKREAAIRISDGVADGVIGGRPPAGAGFGGHPIQVVARRPI